MAHSTKMIGQVFRDALARKIETLPIIIRPQLAPILGLLLDWTDYVEARLAALDEDFPLLDEPAAPVELPSVPVAAAHVQAQIDRLCAGECGE